MTIVEIAAILIAVAFAVLVAISSRVDSASRPCESEQPLQNECGHAAFRLQQNRSFC
jgi:hypothetical protein